MRTVGGLSFLLAATFWVAPSSARAQCAAALAAAQAAVDAAVSCTEVASHAEYVQRGKAALAGLTLPAPCRQQFVREHLKRSVCGRRGRVVCCAVDAKGRTASRIVKAGKCARGDECTQVGGFPRSLGEGCTSSGACVVPPTTTTPTPDPVECPDRAPLPTQAVFTVPASGTDLDVGWSGIFHNFPLVAGSRLVYCLEDCDGTNTSCVGRGPTGPGTPNGASFGPPTPLVAANVPICLVNSFAEPELASTFDLATGDFQGNLALRAELYLAESIEVCPRCEVPDGGTVGSTGTCSATAANPGAACRVDGIAYVAFFGDQTYLLSSSCLPPARLLAGQADLDVPLVTGTSTLRGPLPCGNAAIDDGCGAGRCAAACTGSACAATDAGGNCVDAKGGIAQVCCTNDSTLPCFPTRNGGSLVRTGAPVDSITGAFAGTFCVGSTDSGLLNTLGGLPGPGALVLPVTAAVEPNR